MQSFYHICLFFAWIIFSCIHSVLASIWFKKFITDRAPLFFPYYRLVYSCIASVTLAAILVYQFSHSSFLLFHPGTFVIIPAVLFFCAGLLVMLIGGNKYLSRVLGIDVFSQQKQQNKLEEEGLHRYVRHPVYSGTILTIWSMFLVFPLLSNLIACVMISVYTLIGIGMEERKLILEFGDSYIKYSKRTPMLFPAIGRRTVR